MKPDTAKTGRYVLCCLPYILLFWLFDKCGEAYRLAPGRDILQKFIGMAGGPATAFANPLPSLDPFDLCVGLAGAAAVYLTVLYKKKHAKKWRKDIEYGSARWGNRKDIEPFADPNRDNNVILTAAESLMLDGRPKNPKHARNKNVLVVGGSGSGKTRFWLKPNLMQMHSSYVVTDPKGTILTECGKLLRRGAPKVRAKLGKDGKPLKDGRGNKITEIVRGKDGKIVYEPYEIKVLNTIDFKKSLRYNPFSYIRNEKDILKFTTALIANTKGEDSKSGEDFWQKAEVLLYCALIGFIHYEAPEEEQNMNSLVEMINAMEVHEEDETFKNAVDIMFEKLEKGVILLDDEGNPVLDESGRPVFESPPQPRHFALRQYKKYKLAAGKTAKSILISCGARLAPFDIAELRELMSCDEMELDTLGDRKTALFIIISDTDTTFNFVAALMYSQLFNLLCDRADNEYGGELPVHVRFLLDEFANIGRIPNFDKLIATVRSRKISACIVLQTQSQLKSMYKDNFETIIGNCDSRLFLGGSEKTTLKDLSESLGKETIDLLNHSESKGNSPSFGRNYQKLGKELMSIDELSVLDGAKCILQLRGVRPFLSDKYDITRHPRYKFLSDANPKNAFDVGRFVGTKLKPDPDEEFPLFEHIEADEEMPEAAMGDFPPPDETSEPDGFEDFEEDLEPV
jgi:type IV secretion system protein VirD4